MSLEQFTSICVQLGYAIGTLGASIVFGILVPIFLMIFIGYTRFD